MEQEKSAVEEKVTETNEQTEKPKKKRNWFKIVVLSIITFVVAVFAIVTLTTQKSFKVAGEFMAYLDDGKTEEAYAMVSNEFKEGTNKEQLGEFIDALDGIDLKNAKSVSKEISSSTDEGTKSTFLYEANNADTKYDIEIIVIKENNNWLIYNVKVTPAK